MKAEEIIASFKGEYKQASKWINGRFKHGAACSKDVKFPELRQIYVAWKSMKDRCLNPARKDFERYGGRGIVICERWMKFENFLEDVWPKPEGKSLDRIDNNGPYSPENFRWATRTEQMNNIRWNVRITWRGVTMTISDLARKTKVPTDLIRYRIFVKGMTPEECFTTPIRKYGSVTPETRKLV